jgi:excinuclease ABC subunit C
VLTHRLEFSSARDAEFFSALPAAPAVFMLRGAEANSEPYVTKTANLRRRLTRLLGVAEAGSRRLNLRERVRWVDYSETSSDFESGFLLYKVLREAFPKTYSDRLHLRPAALVKLILENEYPRAVVTSRIGSLKTKNIHYGPFATRVAAEKFCNDSLDFFKMRRCTDDLHPDTAFPGCIYSEMKMCDGPCFKGVSDEAYADEVERVREFFDTGGRSLVQVLTAEREAASTNLDFEAAAAIHAKLEKLKGVRGQLDEIVRPITELRGVMVQPSNEPESVKLFRIEAGMISAPVILRLGAKQVVGDVKSPVSMEARITEALESATVEAPHSAQEWMEHLALLKRWYYRTSKIGEVFFADGKGDLPMRRIVRGVSRVYKGEKPMADLSEAAREYWILRGKEAEEA